MAVVAAALLAGSVALVSSTSEGRLALHDARHNIGLRRALGIGAHDTVSGEVGEVRSQLNWQCETDLTE